MNIINSGHNMKYENECVAMLFFPDEKIVTYDDKKYAVGGEYILTELKKQINGILISVELSFKGETNSLSCIIKEDTANLQDECERIMGIQMHTLLSKATGIKPAWGILTGVRPVKLFHKRLDNGVSPQDTAREFAERFLVTPEKINLALKTAAQEEPILKEVTDDSFSLYVSVPFCPSRCNYCSFVSHSIASKKARDLLPEYTRLLCKEIEYTGKIAKEAGLRLSTVYYGGGTPTTLSAQQLDCVCKAVAKSFDLSDIKEYTVEAGRPDTLDEEKCRVLLANGVTRISINPQTLNDDVLKEIGRGHTAKQTVDAFYMARKAGFDNINMDLIAGLPKDTVQSFKDTVDKVILLNPENITVHTLSIKRSSDYGADEDRKNALEAATQVEEMVSYAQEKLLSNGFLPYYLYKQRNTLGNLENTGYCKPNCEGRYNIYIMDEAQTILAVGGAGVTKLKSNRTGDMQRIFNYKYPFEYISKFDEILKRKDKVVDFFEKNRPI